MILLKHHSNIKRRGILVKSNSFLVAYICLQCILCVLLFSCTHSHQNAVQSPTETNSRESPPDGEQTAPEEHVVILENLYSGQVEEQWLRRGDILRIGQFQLVYQEGHEYRYIDTEGSLEINGQFVGVSFNNYASNVIPEEVEEFRGRTQAIKIEGSGELDPTIAEAIEQMASDHFSLELVLEDVEDPKLNRLDGLALKLEHLVIRAPRMVDSALASLAQFTNLRSLEIESEEVSNDGLAHLSGLANLEQLSLPMGISDAGLSHISQLSRLEVLSLSFTSVTDFGLGSLAQFPNLRELRLYEIPITDNGLGHLAHLPELRVLDLPRTITDVGIAHLAELTHISELDLSGTQITDSGLEILAGFPELRVLYLPERITDSGIAHLAGLTNLRLLTMGYTQLSNEGLRNLSGFTDLRELDIHRTQIDDSGLRHLARMTHLRTLDIAHTQVSDAGLVHISPLANLRVLNLAGTQITDAGLSQISGLQHLSRLYLEGNITDSGLGHLAELENLKYLSLGETEVTAGAIAEFRREHPRVEISQPSIPDNN